jgi:bifunctional UDP-N-acetylglucosamine pyrophosphorylase/glucosamine-1-phosphate N-acetyltransferase
MSHLFKQACQKTPANGLNLLTAKFSDPSGFGRIIRDKTGTIKSIVEHKDASTSELLVNEINSGILATSSKVLRDYLPRLRKRNTQSEYYLTDITAMLVKDGLLVKSLSTSSAEEVSGINNKKQLATLNRQYQKELANKLMLQGLSLMDPARFDLRGDLKCSTDVTIDINVVIEGKVSIGANTSVGPNNCLKNTKIGKNVTIKANCVIEDAIIEDDCVVGPFARIRPGTRLEKNSRVGNFVEIKNTKLGKNSKANHLSYLGDTTVGDKVNIGAGTITCNYDGVNKHKTTIESCAFIGSNTALIAPVKIGKNAVIAAGSVITKDAPAEQLTIARTKQTTIENWTRKKKKKD